MSTEYKLVMPKGDGTLEATEYSLEVYYKYKDMWVNNEIFKKEIHDKFKFNEKKDGPFLIKKSEIAKYFGLIVYNAKKREAKITERGIKYHLCDSTDKKIDLVFEAISNDTFGCDNCVVPSSTSKVDPPKLLIKSIYELNYVTKEEFAYILYYAHNLNWNFNDIITEIYNLRKGKLVKHIVSKENINKYNDVKFIVFFTNLGIIKYKNKQYSFNSNIYNKYYNLIENIEVYNRRDDGINTIYINEDYEDYANKNNIDYENPYIIDGKALEVQNNRQPELVSYSNNKPKYKVNNRIKKTAIEMSGYKCNISSNHITFKNKLNKYYMEGHHFIPMSAQADFNDINLDRTENIATLCPNCHRAIHYGNDQERFNVLKNLYDIKITKLIKIGIDISLEDLFNKYYK